MGILEVTAQGRHFKFAVICNLDADCMYLREEDDHSIHFFLGPFVTRVTRASRWPLHRFELCRQVFAARCLVEFVILAFDDVQVPDQTVFTYL